MSNDCSERICPFGLAHVDTPMGDLDASSGQLTDAATTVIVNDAMYPQGTTEQFPAMKDTAGGVKINSAHYYRECSNKGMCDRSSGECECFEGYEGSSCQRASCPVGSNGVCSGHGTCETISELAGRDNENIYRLWDEDITMGCHCDAGYTGPDCASRSCKVGTDPLYYDDFQNIRYSNQTVQFYIMNDNAEIYGNYSLVFTDVYGEDWQTEPIDIDASCAVIQDRLESLPNDVIPYGTVKCYKSEEARHVASDITTGDPVWSADPGKMDPGTNNVANDGQVDAISLDPSGQQKPTDASYTVSGSGNSGESIFFAGHYAIVNKFVLAFSGNPGDIAPLKVNRFLDGKRPTLFSTETIAQPTLGVHIYSDGFHGETTDYVNDECEGVLVSLSSAGVAYAAAFGNDVEKFTHNLKFYSNIEFERLKRCLGDSDGVSTNNVEVYDWDYGTFMNPHLIKLVDATQDRFTEYIRADGSSYKVLDAGKTPAGGGDGWENFPMTKLCARSQPWQNDNYMGTPEHPLVLDNVEASNLGTYGWCRDTNPPGFFAILYFDDCTAGGVSQTLGFLSMDPSAAAGDEKSAGTEACAINKDGFRLLTRPATDYAHNTKFHVFTTKGTLQQVSQQSEAYTTSHQEKLLPHSGANSFAKVNPKFVHNFHSNVIHVKNRDTGSGQGEIDCETAAIGTKNNFDCLNKGDKIFLVNLGTRENAECAAAGNADMHGNVAASANNCFYKATADSFASNPKYPNMYTVKKIAYIPKDPNQADSPEFNAAYIADSTHAEAAANVLALHAAGYRHQITLDMGVNTMYMANLDNDDSAGAAHDANGAVTDAVTTATIYKFHPPTLATTGSTGYDYVGECSNRGICGDEGICECFGGYTGDDCGKINSLAQ